MPRRNPSTRSRRAPQRTKQVLHGIGGEPGSSFRCLTCRLDIPTEAPGTAHRNHCPNCLASRHVDGRIPGDRAQQCRGAMAALSLTVRHDGEWMLVHQCLECNTLKVNRIAGDDNALVLLRLALRPLADPRLGSRALLAL
ncbi:MULTISPECIES: RNHCP domain-containing protein [unclassified Rhodococcus (in: high G+C Gram-positive bacteria)]|uniref:RNHCP domain-containing protein n=1 Tax=unclassified Rhodococcus (in: high G+C Gram-positive bacteria) TaxID=192944 RepID=UPI0029547823|nr:RNHCP domain-containing protein [Rhodococcus sp. IEGM 1318]MDV8003504.1 RNHCP domain-containing protein [Rhodococcus sp. IEGM 1318]MDZ7911012.1 RNHCP domain-containing protein [Rhodococcus sp. (in: high G+C Gram-positive bacteria)]